MARPTIFTEQLSDDICNRLMAGESLRSICASDDMPNRITVIRWMGQDESFATKCAGARAEQADLMDDKIFDVAEGVLSGDIKPDAGRVAIAAYQWRAEKLKPKKYGQRITQEHTGDAFGAFVEAISGKSDGLPE